MTLYINKRYYNKWNQNKQLRNNSRPIVLYKIGSCFYNLYNGNEDPNNFNTVQEISLNDALTMLTEYQHINPLDGFDKIVLKKLFRMKIWEGIEL